MAFGSPRGGRLSPSPQIGRAADPGCPVGGQGKRGPPGSRAIRPRRPGEEEAVAAGGSSRAWLVGEDVGLKERPFELVIVSVLGSFLFFQSEVTFA